MKRTPVRTKTLAEDYALKMAHLIGEIERQPKFYMSPAEIIQRAYAFAGEHVLVVSAKVVQS